MPTYILQGRDLEAAMFVWKWITNGWILKELPFGLIWYYSKNVMDIQHFKYIERTSSPLLNFGLFSEWVLITLCFFWVEFSNYIIGHDSCYTHIRKWIYSILPNTIIWRWKVYFFFFTNLIRKPLFHSLIIIMAVMFLICARGNLYLKRFMRLFYVVSLPEFKTISIKILGN